MEKGSGLQYWRTLEELAGSERVRQLLAQEFPEYDPDDMLKPSRRRFMQLMGASMALAGLTLSGCRRWPKEKLAPYSSNPTQQLPGIEEYFATTMELGGVGMGLLATSYDGRPIKLEGNPLHPYARSYDKRLGSADSWAQASVLNTYDPERSRTVVQRKGDGKDQGAVSSWEAFEAALKGELERAKVTGGASVAILSEYLAGPSSTALRAQIAKAYPKLLWCEYEPLHRDNEMEGAKMAFGQALRPILHLEQASTVVLFDADVLGMHPAHIRYSADWVSRRKTVDGKTPTMSRTYMIESQFSPTGSIADARLGVRPSRQLALVTALGAKLGVAGMESPRLDDDERKFVDAAAADLKKSGVEGVVAAGAALEPRVHAAVHAINEAIGASGHTVTYVAEPAERGSMAAIGELIKQIKGGEIKTLLIIGGNAAYDGPADLDVAGAIQSVPFRAHLSLYDNETSQLCTWHVNRAHYLEAWGDSRAWDGTVGTRQPLIQPLFNGRSEIEFLAMIAGAKPDGEAIMRGTFQELLKGHLEYGGDFEKTFRKVLCDGIMPQSAWAAVKPGAVMKAPGRAQVEPESSEVFEIRFLEENSVYDGRFSNNAWLQELPDVVTKLVWDNAAMVSPRDAERLGVKQNGDMVSIDAGGRKLKIAAYILPGQPLGVVGLPLGYGKTAGGRLGAGLGFNTYTLRTTGGMYCAGGARVENANDFYQLAWTQDHHMMDKVGINGLAVRVGPVHGSGPVIKETTLANYVADRRIFQRHGDGRISLQLYEPPMKFNDPHAWGMAVDMSACVACNACVVACQAENNIPVVGKDNVIRNREMHWIRIDRYFKGSPDEPEITYQPMFCQQCENAPCEEVCPVAATTHDTEGLNVMVYNRCVGTRYCQNNCPYKVRRFNFFDWNCHDPRTNDPPPFLNLPDLQPGEQINPLKAMVFNPEVTVRMRGVMEKCMYCVQRIKKVTIDKANKGIPVEDGDIFTACQQACPTQALVFGDLNDENSLVSRMHQTSRTYAVLDEELQTKPRTKYLAKISNPVA